MQSNKDNILDKKTNEEVKAPLSVPLSAPSSAQLSETLSSQATTNSIISQDSISSDKLKDDNDDIHLGLSLKDDESGKKCKGKIRIAPNKKK